MKTAPGHWILVRMGKRVLRPGGREMSLKLLSELDIQPQDHVVEFAPGIGFTAEITINKNPLSYVGVDEDEDIVQRLRGRIKGRNVRFIHGNAADSGLSGDSKDKVYGEAMLTMHDDHLKSGIIREAHRLLKKGGIYAIHEMGLRNADEAKKREIERDMSESVRINARPLTEEEWSALLENEGFSIRQIYRNEMLLLEPLRFIDDEGFFRTLKILLSIMRNPMARKRIIGMRRTFARHREHINSLVIIAEKK